MEEKALNEGQEGYLRVEKLIDEVLEKYYSSGCACRYPRFLQIAGIDCSEYGLAFVCWETELMIGRVSEHFSATPVEPKGENYQEQWTCNYCDSTFMLSWSDFSAVIDRRVLKPIDIKLKSSGKDALFPIPLHAGLYGHGYPERTKICSVDFNTLRQYLLEYE
jgi:hypothetical protein